MIEKDICNTCATRVSLRFAQQENVGEKIFEIQKGDFKGKGFITSAGSLKMAGKSVWGARIFEVPGLSNNNTAV